MMTKLYAFECLKLLLYARDADFPNNLMKHTQTQPPARKLNRLLSAPSSQSSLTSFTFSSPMNELDGNII